MKRSRRVNRSFVSGADTRTAAHLASRAGRGPERAGPEFDRLEPRQLLSTIDFTVDPADPFFNDPLASIRQNLDGSYTVTASWGYLIPYIVPAADLADNIDVERILEEFNDAGDVNTQIGGGTIVADSNLLVGGAIFTLIQVPGADDDLRLGGILQPGEFIEFSFLSGDTPGSAALAFDSMRFDFLQNLGGSVVDPSQFEVTFLLRGEVIQGATALLSDLLGGAALPVTAFDLTLPGGSTPPFFDTVRFTNINDSLQQALVVDNISALPDAGVFADIVDARMFGATMSFTAPLGATIKVFDLYNRPMELTFGVGKPDGDFNLALSDLDDNGIPEFNDGIGRIEITGTDEFSSFALFGGTLEASDTGDGFDNFSGGFGFNNVEDSALLTEDLVGAHYGLIGRLDENDTWISSGLAGPVSVIVGSPFIRPLDNYNPDGIVLDGRFDGDGIADTEAIATTNSFLRPFAREDQGIFVTDGSNINEVYVAGVLNGSSKFTGYVDHLYAGVLHGTISVDGDLGSLTVGADAGLWVPAAGYNDVGQLSGFDSVLFGTISEVIVGRTLGEFFVGGRSFVALTVIGDLGDAENAPPRDTQIYIEREFIAQIDPALTGAAEATLGVMFSGRSAGFRRAEIIGESVFRNDSILSSEFVGNVSSSVRIFGQLGFQDGLHTAEDLGDVYALPVDGTRPIIVELGSFSFNLNVRIMDQDGRTVAAIEGFDEEFQTSGRIRFDPLAPGVYYLVVGASSGAVIGDGGFDSGPTYELLVTGMAPVTLGAVTVAGYMDELSSVNVLNGSIGAIRVGTALIGGDGQGVTSGDFVNRPLGDDAYLSLRGGSYSTRENLYQIVVGSDIEGNQSRFLIGGNLGALVTGLAPQAQDQGAGLEGDVIDLRLDIGGAIGVLDIRGGIGIDNDPPAGPNAAAGGTGLVIRTGTETGDGDIGLIRVGGHVVGSAFDIVTANNSVIGAFLVSQDLDPAGLSAGDVGIWGGGFGAGDGISTGIGSDVRFVSFPEIDLLGNANSGIAIVGGVPIELVDDGGGRVIIQVLGGTAGVTYGFVRFLPISGSEGVAIAQIDITLNNGGAVNPGMTLSITSTGSADDVISIGRINITDGVAATNLITGSIINISGNAEIDIWQIIQTGGQGFGQINNTTPSGDIISVDVVGLNSLNIVNGHLGMTELDVIDSRMLGRIIGLQSGENNQILGAVGVNLAAMTDAWNGGIYRPILSVPDGTAGFADDVGIPLNPYLTGLVVRGGSVQTITVGGSIVNVVLQGGAGATIVTLVANADKSTPLGDFHGIIGVIYADIIENINVGDGLVGNADSPILTSGIIATDDIRTIIADLPGAGLSGVIQAFNITGGTPVNGQPADADGIVNLLIRSDGDYRDLEVRVSSLHHWWNAQTFVLDFVVVTGDIHNVQSDDADIFRSTLVGLNIRTINLKNGFIDASTIRSLNDIISITAGGYRNSTLAGAVAEFRPNQISVGGDLGTLTTTGTDGDIRDTLIEVIGDVTTKITAENIIRSRINVANTIKLIQTDGDFSGSEIVTGQLLKLLIGDTLATTSIKVAGPLVEVTVGVKIINSEFLVTGPDGRIDTISTPEFLGGSVSSTGAIQLIEATEGDLDAFISTTTARGSVDLITAARDLNISTDIAGRVGELVAGRHVGSLGSDRVILIRSDLSLLNAGGQLYSDLRVSRTINEILLGRIRNLPGDNQLGQGIVEAFDRIERVTIVGDFDGSIRSFSNGIGLVEIRDGSFLAGNDISAYDGHIDEVRIVSGNLYGNVHADWILFNLTIIGSADGVFGDLGVNESLSSFAPYDEFRNQLPPGVGASSERQGPIISAGWNLGIVTVTNGSIFEATLIAGWAIGFITVNGDISADTATKGSGTLGTAIIADDSIFMIDVSGIIEYAWIIAGASDLGDDLTPGGTGDNADTVSSGFIETIRAAEMFAVVTSAGVNPGEDGIYNTGDDMIEPGVSFIRNIETTGVKTFVSSFSEAFGVDLIAQGDVFLIGKLVLPVNSDDVVVVVTGTQLTPGVVFAFTHGAETGTLLFNGPGNAYWDEAKGLVTLENTEAFSSTLTVTSATGTLTNFDISTTNDASIGTLEVRANLAGDSTIYIDAYASNIITGNFDGTGGIIIGQHATTITTGSFRAKTLSGKNLAWVNINGDFGSSTFDVRGISGVDILSSGFFTVTGNVRGRINIERVVTSLVVGQSIDNALIRAGVAISSFEIGSARESRISVGDFLDRASFFGDVFDTSILVGGDLGPDADYDSINGLGNDRATSGFAGPIFIGGDFIQSDIIGGSLRGADGFHGSDDDLISKGRSVIGSVEIVGQAIGSNRDTEAYRVWATGAVNDATVGGDAAINAGNLEFGLIETMPLPISALDLQVTERNREYIGRIFFNQPMDISTFSAALTIAEIRGQSGDIRIDLVEGVDYRIDYEPEDNAMVIFFSSDLTSRNLPQTDLPGPGLYRFDLDQSTLRASVVQARLDGNGNGLVTVGENYSADDVVGDAGDKIADVPPATIVDPVTGAVSTIDFYTPIDLDILLDSNVSPNGLPDVNQTFTIRGSIGDHADHNVDFFRFAGDVDLYEITLQAGQILRLGGLTGTAFLATQQLISPEGVTGATLTLPNNGIDADVFNSDSNILIKKTGTYYISISNFFLIAEFLQDNTVFNLANVASGVGDYAFTIEVFDDGNTGFAGSADSGDGDNIQTAPEFSAFAGNDGIIGTPDDAETVTRGDFVFRIDPGQDGVIGTADDVVRGTNGRGAVSERTTDNRLRSIIQSTIGSGRATGVPGFISPDIDVFNLNGGLTINAGTKMKITVKLSEIGGDLGSRNINTFADLSGGVQFGLFNTTNATDVSNAELIFSPTEFTPIGGTPNTELANDGTTSYGFDQNGDFYIEFVTPQGAPATYAVYIQGVFNTDYELEITTDTETGVLVKRFQNIVLELNGGTVDWLEVGGFDTRLAGFDLSSIGLVGSLDNGQSVDDFVVELLIGNLEAIYAAAGLDVRFSTTPADFEFQDFSTIFISTSPDPLTPLLSSGLIFGEFAFGGFGVFFSGQPYGYSQRSDAFNADRNDEAVVFLDPLGLLGQTPTESDLRDFTQALTASVGRRVGELMGVRMSESDFFGGGVVFDLQASSSVEFNPGGFGSFVIADFFRQLSGRFDSIGDTQFYLGGQNARSILDSIIISTD